MRIPTTPLKKADVCKLLGISPRTLDNLVRDQKFPPGVRIGRWTHWSPSAIDHYHARLFKMQENWTPIQSRG